MASEKDQHTAGLSQDAPSSEASPRETSAAPSSHPATDEPEQTSAEEIVAPALSTTADEPHHVETAHVLFMDIVGFTRLPNNKQTQALKQLLEVVRNTDEYRRALAKDQLLRLPTGDGMALVFFNDNPIVPVRCAQQVCSALRTRDHEFGLRMGINSGPITRVENIDNRPNVAGDGINIAQRVMDCGDAGHILLSSAVADYLKSFDEWAHRIRDLKQVRVKNRKRVHVFNLSDAQIGNRKLPAKIRKHRLNKILLFGSLALISVALIVAAVVHLRSPQKKFIQSVAILPLVNAGGEANYLSSTIARDINIKLRAVAKDFDVQPDPGISIENNSHWADPLYAGQRFNAQAVVYVTNENPNEIKVRIMDARNNVVIEDTAYDLKAYGVKGVAGQISLDILGRLTRSDDREALKLVAKQDTKSDKAYDLYAKGRAALDQRTGEGLEASVNFFKQATEEDPSFAPAYAGLAVAYNVRGGYTDTTPQENYPLAKRAANEALRLDQKLVEAHYALGYTLTNYDYQWAAAEQEFNNAVNLDPKSGTARYFYAFNYLISQGMMDKAISEMEQAQRLAPESLIISTNLGWTYYYAGDYRRAIDQYKQILSREPRFERARYRLIEAYEQMGEYDEAVAQWQAWINTADDEKTRSERKLFVETIQAGEAKTDPRVYWQNYLEAREQQARDPQNGPIPPYIKAGFYAMLGRREDALVLLRRSYDLKDESLIKLAVNPRFASLRAHKDFINLVNLIGLKFPSKIAPTQNG
jgi:class 3 adenylate cyclase/tetratricopeptide (TPR) repeat protein